MRRSGSARPHLPEQPVRRQVPGSVERAGVLQHVGRGQAPPDHQAGAHRRGLRHRGQDQEVAGQRAASPRDSARPRPP